jgi:hypothetical protein
VRPTIARISAPMIHVERCTRQNFRDHVVGHRSTTTFFSV